MKTTITIISLSAILACLTLSAQESPRPAGSGLAERFKQLDKNGDGRLTVEEVGVPTAFKAADTNGDGFVSPEEFAVYMEKRLGGRKGMAKAKTPEQGKPRVAELPAAVEVVKTLDVR